MTRHAAKHLPKPFRRLKAALARLGAVDVAVETSNARYLVSWSFVGIAMRVAIGHSSSGNDFESAWQAVRRAFRQHHLAVL